MNNPDAPFLEIAFYFSELDGDSALEKLMKHLIGQGAIAKIAYTTHRASSPLVGFDIRVQEHRIDQSSILPELFRNETVSITKIAIEKGTRVVSNTREFVVQLPINEKSAGKDHSPIAIWIEGEALSYPPTPFVPAKARQVGKRAFRVFREMILTLCPSYGSVTVDYGLECPTDLKRDPRTYAFRDFYVATEFIGEDCLASIRQTCQDAYHDELPGGQITCCSNFLAPIEIDVVTANTFALSEQVGRMIASRSNKKRCS